MFTFSILLLRESFSLCRWCLTTGFWHLWKEGVLLRRCRKRMCDLFLFSSLPYFVLPRSFGSTVLFLFEISWSIKPWLYLHMCDLENAFFFKVLSTTRMDGHCCVFRGLSSYCCRRPRLCLIDTAAVRSIYIYIKLYINHVIYKWIYKYYLQWKDCSFVFSWFIEQQWSFECHLPSHLF